MLNTIAYEMSFWFFTIDFGSSPLGAVLAVLAAMLVLIASIDGMTIAFRGIRDSIASYTRKGGPPNILMRLASTIVALFLFLTGGALVIGLAAWICGASALFRRVSVPKKKTTKGLERPAEESLSA